jgi:hypothetical protein
MSGLVRRWIAKQQDAFTGKKMKKKKLYFVP